MKVVIDGRGFNTDKALHHWLLTWRDRAGEPHEGHVYQASSGLFDCYSRTEASWEPKWQMTGDPTELLKLCHEYLTQEDQVEIAEIAQLECE